MGGVISGRFSNVDNFRPEVDSDVIFGVVIDPTGMKVPIKFGDSIKSISRYTTASLCDERRRRHRRTPIIT